MKAVQITDGVATLVDRAAPEGAGVRVRIAVSSICGSDLHLLDLGMAEGQVLGHEFAGYAPDGTAVAVEPLLGCGECDPCESGHLMMCAKGGTLLGVGVPGGMAEEIIVPGEALVPIPTGLPMTSASLIEPIAVAAHSINRAGVRSDHRVLIIGAGAIGLAVAVVLGARGIRYDVSARHEHQRSAADRLGGGSDVGDGYDIVMDAVGTTESLEEAALRLRPMGCIGLVGSIWDPAEIGMLLCIKECTIVPAMTYVCRTPDRNFTDAARVLADNPEIADVIITHRFSLDGCADAFTTAADRASGAIKVAFDI